MSEINWDDVPLGKKADTEIAAELGVSRWAVRGQRIYRGIASVQTKLTEADIEQIYSMRAQGFKMREIAEEVGCCVSSVGNIILAQRHRQTVHKVRAKQKAGEIPCQKEDV